jgi:hypothetical protein
VIPDSTRGFQASIWRQNKIYLGIVRFRRNFCQQLKIICDTAFYPGGPFQQPVVKSEAAAETVP